VSALSLLYSHCLLLSAMDPPGVTACCNCCPFTGGFNSIRVAAKIKVLHLESGRHLSILKRLLLPLCLSLLITCDADAVINSK